ncbi:MAG: PIN domain-containing protein [Deltaproteobacteria bacterium]|nr:PIN domain-containing protein [Deltaproteobacteria bacterium]
MRSLLVLFASVSGYLIIYQIVGNQLAYIGLVSGLLIAVLALIFEDRVKRAPLRIVMGGAIGLIIGLIVANLLTYPLMLNNENIYLELSAYLLANCVIGYLGLSIGMKKGDEFDGSAFITHFKEGRHQDRQAGNDGAPRQHDAAKGGLIVDTSVIIDGRIAEVCETGFLDGRLIVPQFVLQELQYIADSPDPIKRARGKRGLDVLKTIQANKKVEVSISDKDYHDIREVDSKLVALARETNGRILTNDANLHKVAELRGVQVLNINKLATAMKPVVLPGEIMNILVLKEGKEHNQGVGYLEDGTMVVIDNARDHLGKMIDVSITSVLQTTGGRMIFSKVRDESKRQVYQ